MGEDLNRGSEANLPAVPDGAAAAERSAERARLWPVPVEGGVEHRIDGVHLGRIIGEGGWNQGYRDEVLAQVPGAGFGLRVEQNSAGYTGISVIPEGGNRLAAGAVDPDTNELVWNDQSGHDGSVRVAGDWGNLINTPLNQWNTDAVGNPGVRGGVVRVTDEAGASKTFLLGANFEGQPDDWQVSGGQSKLYSIPNPEPCRQLDTQNCRQRNPNKAHRFTVDIFG